MPKKLLLIWGRQCFEPPRAAEPLATPLCVDLFLVALPINAAFGFKNFSLVALRVKRLPTPALEL